MLVEENGIGACAEGRVGKVFVAVVRTAPGTLRPEGQDRLPEGQGEVDVRQVGVYVLPLIALVGEVRAWCWSSCGEVARGGKGAICRDA